MKNNSTKKKQGRGDEKIKNLSNLKTFQKRLFDFTKTISLSEMENKFGLSHSTIESYYNGKRDNPKIDNVISIAKGLRNDCSLDYLLGLTDSRNINNNIKISDIIGLSDINISKFETINSYINDITNNQPKDRQFKDYDKLKKLLGNNYNGLDFEFVDLLNIRMIFNYLLENKNICSLLYLIYIYICSDNIDDLYCEFYMGDINEDNFENHRIDDENIIKNFLSLEMISILDKIKNDFQKDDSRYIFLNEKDKNGNKTNNIYQKFISEKKENKDEK